MVKMRHEDSILLDELIDQAKDILEHWDDNSSKDDYAFIHMIANLRSD